MHAYYEKNRIGITVMNEVSVLLQATFTLSKCYLSTVKYIAKSVSSFFNSHCNLNVSKLNNCPFKANVTSCKSCSPSPNVVRCSCSIPDKIFFPTYRRSTERATVQRLKCLCFPFCAQQANTHHSTRLATESRPTQTCLRNRQFCVLFELWSFRGILEAHLNILFQLDTESECMH